MWHVQKDAADFILLPISATMGCVVSLQGGQCQRYRGCSKNFLRLDKCSLCTREQAPWGGCQGKIERPRMNLQSWLRRGRVGRKKPGLGQQPLLPPNVTRLGESGQTSQEPSVFHLPSSVNRHLNRAVVRCNYNTLGGT